MKSQNLPSNFTNAINQTEGIDIFCIKLLVGPAVWGVFTLLCSLVGIFSSLWLLWVLIKRQRSNVHNDIYMLNLTVMDLLFNLSLFPYVVNFFFWQNYLYFKISDILYCLNMTAQPLFIAVICVDCYMAVVCPVLYMRLKRSNHRLAVCVSVWALSLFNGIMYFFNNWLYVSSVSVVPYIISLPTIAFCDLSVLHALRKPDPSGRSDVHPQKQRALQAITNSFIMAVISYLPPMLGYGFLALIPLSLQEIYCHVALLILIAPGLGAAIMPLLHLENLGCLNLKRCGCVRC